MDHDLSKLELLRQDVLEGRLDRRAVLKRGAALGLSAPVIAALLAACGGSSKATATKPAAAATATTGTTAAPTATSGSSTGGASSPTATTGSTTASPSASAAASEEASPTTASSGNVYQSPPGHGRGKADLLRILYWQAPTILNQHFSQGTKDSAASSLVQEPLIDIHQDGTLIPILAAEIPSLDNGGVAKDGMSVTYKLKQGVTWSDGEPFTANDVRFTWQYATDVAATTVTIAIFDPVSDVQVVDDNTVTIKFKQPTPGWYSIFATGFGGAIVPQHILKDSTGAAARDAPFNLKPIGTGPYVVDDFKPGDVVNYSINDKYRDADKPYFSKIELKGGGDANAAATASLQTGETDWGWNLQVEKQVLDQLSASGGSGTLLATTSSNVEHILCNFADPNKEVDGAKSEPSTQHPYLSDKNVRNAFALATDRDTVAKQLYGQAGDPTANILVAPTNMASPNTSYKFDTDAANAMLDAAGWTKNGDTREKNGVQMKALYQTTVNAVRQKTQEIVKAGWTAIGCSVELKSIDAGVYFSSDAGNPDTASHFYADFEMFTNGPSVPYPISYMADWKSENPAVDLAQKSNQWAGVNTERWVNADFNKLYEQALVELDPAKQVQLFIAMNDLIVNEFVDIALVARKNVVGVSKKLAGYDSYGNSTWTPDVANIADWYFTS